MRMTGEQPGLRGQEVEGYQHHGNGAHRERAFDGHVG